MKNIFKTTIILALISTIFSCTEVVDVALDTENPRLVIEAGINWEKGTAGNIQKIKLTTTTNYYNNTIPVVSGAVITVTNSANVVFNFTENPGSGIYVCNNFIPVLNQTYTLKIISNGKTYIANETMTSVATIKNIIQEANAGITGKDIRIRCLYDDPANVDNFYLYRYIYPRKSKPDLYADEDEFFRGNEFFSSSFTDDLKQGDVINIRHLGMSKKYFNFMTILLSISGSQGGGPFQSPPVTVRGNIINTNNQDDFPFGYFNLSETVTRDYTVQ
jgi:hypothetical protein